MAKNVRLKAPKASKLYICDVNQTIVNRFLDLYSKEGEIIVCKTAKEVAEQAVRLISSPLGTTILKGYSLGCCNHHVTGRAPRQKRGFRHREQHTQDLKVWQAEAHYRL